MCDGLVKIVFTVMQRKNKLKSIQWIKSRNCYVKGDK